MSGKETHHMSLPFLNRDAYLVKPTKKFADWLRHVDETTEPRDADDLLGSPGTIYLFGELDTGERAEAEVAMRKHWKKIAASEFEGWWTNEADWPRLKSIADFDEYFDWVYVEMVNDLSSKTLLRE